MNTNINEARQQLLGRLEEQKTQLQHDVEDLKKASKPGNIIRNIASDIGKGLTNNRVAADTVRMAVTVLPRTIRRHPLVSVGLTYVVPYMIRHYPQIREVAGDALTLPKKSTLLRNLRDGVRSMRRKLHNLQYQYESGLDQPVHHVGSFTSGSPY